MTALRDHASAKARERMLLVADKGREDEVFRVFKKVGASKAAEIGTSLPTMAASRVPPSWRDRRPKIPNSRTPPMRRPL